MTTTFTPIESTKNYSIKNFRTSWRRFFKNDPIPKVPDKDGTITKFLGKFSEYKPTKEEEENFKLKAICENVIYDISDSDSDLESTARSGPRDSEMEDTGGSEIRINA
ncbi:hypothetical protein Tco_0247160 [Tanacetum coccineum]